MRTVKGEVENDFRTKMEQPKVSVFYVFSGDADYNLKNRMTMTYLTQALSNRYLRSIREEKGGTYGVSVSGVIQDQPVDSYMMQIAFDTNEEMADELCGIVMAEIEKIAAEGPLAEDMDKTREYQLKNLKKVMEQNGWWSQAITQWYDHKIDYTTEYEAAINAVTADDVKAFMGKMLDDGNLVKVIMRPEK